MQLIKYSSVSGYSSLEMVVPQPSVWFVWLFTLQVAQTKAFYLPEMVLQQLNGSSAQFDAWTRQLSESLNLEQQQRLAWNVHFLETLKSTQQLEQLERSLSPRIGTKNPLKLWLWIRFYWQLRRSQRLSQKLLPQFALTLRQLKTDPHWASDQVQNMLQSLPRHLGVLARSQWLCPKHVRDQLYVLPDGILELGISNNCCMWQVKAVESFQEWIRLENACEMRESWFINMLETSDKGSYMLQTTSSDNSSTFCIRKGAGYLAEGRAGTEDEATKLRLKQDCHWQLNDCTQLPALLNKYYKG